MFYGGMPQQMQAMPPQYMPRGGYPMGAFGPGGGRCADACVLDVKMTGFSLHLAASLRCS